MSPQFPIVKGVEVLMEAPEGYEVDFDNPQLDHINIRAAIALFVIEYTLCLLFFGQRIYTNAILLRNFRIDDYIFVGAFILATTEQILVVYMYTTGLLGAHAYEMSLDKHNFFGLMLTISTLVYIVTTILSKVTLCFFYYRLSPAAWYRYSVWATGIICAGSLIGLWFAVVFTCSPVAAAWDMRLVADAKCIDRPPVYITQAAFGSATDLLLLILPIPTLVGLQMNRRKKVGLIALFSIGSVTLITSIVRLVLLLPSMKSTDQPWALSGGCVWVIVEANLLIMCCSLPTLRVFLNSVFPTIFGENSTKGSSGDVAGGYKNGKGASGGNRAGSNLNIRTFGAGNPRRKFDTLVELEHDLHFKRDDDGLRPFDGADNDVQVYGGRHGRRPSTTSEGGEITETGSEEGIVHTRTTTVSYANL